jgi:hypothetical protein
LKVGWSAGIHPKLPIWRFRLGRAAATFQFLLSLLCPQAQIDQYVGLVTNQLSHIKAK